jgi:hypothetical protein
MGFKVDPDYVDVAERIREFKNTYPDGTLQPVDHDNPYIVQEVAGETVIVYRAAAFRTPDDPRPGIGVASEPYPGKTPYTKGSEIQNAETSAWGRAIVALGIPTKRVASSEEVRNREAERETRPQQQRAQQDQQREQAAQPTPPPASATPKPNGTITRTQAERLRAIIAAKGRTDSGVLGTLKARGIGDGEHFSTIPSDQFGHIEEALGKLADPLPPEPVATVDASDFEEAPTEVPEADPAPPTPAADAEPSGPETGEEPPGMDAAAYKAYREEEAIRSAGKPKRKATVTPQQLTRLGALCGSLESNGVGRDEWRLYLLEREGVSSRKDLTKAAATRAIDYLARWATDAKTGVAVPGDRAVA